MSEAAKTVPGAPVPEEPAANIDTPEDDAVAVRKSLDTREGRNATANEYNAVLEELRSQYGEAEAMRRFDEFMESEGFERVTARSHGMSASGGLSGMLRAFTGAGLSTAGMPHIEGNGPLTSNLSANSTLMGALVDGEVKYFAETYANYGANANQDVLDALNGLYRKNLESAQSGTSIDLAEYMKNNFSSNPQTSVVSASADLGVIAANLLEAAGIELGEDGAVSFSLKDDGSGLYITSGVDDYEAAQKAIDAALRKNPDMLQAFKDEYNSTALTDASILDGAYDDGTHSVEYEDAQRSFTYSAREPSAVVMTDYVGVKITGYNYQKKISDSFDTDADFHTVNDGGVRFTNDNGTVSLDSEDVAANQAIRRKMNEDIRKALESGEEIEGGMTRKEYAAVQTERSAGFVDPAEMAAKAKLYSATPGAEQANRVAEARQALLDLEADPRMRDREISYVDEQQEMRKATASQLLELFAPNRKTPGFDMTNSIMGFLQMGGRTY
ncbi:MAG: hypothetical protein LBS30_06145 [Planctomycetota bacterium]|nr:hypothetical protein [Planctomycetota bacterium]